MLVTPCNSSRSTLTLKGARRLLEERNGLAKNALDTPELKDLVKKLVDQVRLKSSLPA